MNDDAPSKPAWYSTPLIIADFVIPGMTGPEMVTQLKSMGLNIPVLYVSGNQAVEGAHWLLKPFTLESLTQAVSTLLNVKPKPSSGAGSGST